MEEMIFIDMRKPEAHVKPDVTRHRVEQMLAYKASVALVISVVCEKGIIKVFRFS